MIEEEWVIDQIMSYYFAIVVFLWLRYWLVECLTINYLPMWLIYASWPLILFYSLEVIYSFKHWKDKLRISLIIVAFLIAPSIYGTYSLAQYRSKSKQFLNIVIEALNLVRNSTSFSEEEGILGNIKKDSLLTIVYGPFTSIGAPKIPDNEYIRKCFGGDIFISPKFGKIPQSINNVRTVVVVERKEKVTATYTYNSDRQWLYRVTVIDWQKHRVVQTKTFAGSVLPAVKIRPAGYGGLHGTEPWEPITSWLFKDT
jgi:hypothetical protein